MPSVEHVDVEVGKWHLGYCHPSYLPTRRGFSTSLGQWTHVTNYYTRITEYQNWPDTPQDMFGYDWHDGEDISHLGEGEFSTDFLTKYRILRGNCEMR